MATQLGKEITSLNDRLGIHEQATVSTEIAYEEGREYHAKLEQLIEQNNLYRRDYVSVRARLRTRVQKLIDEVGGSGTTRSRLLNFKQVHNELLDDSLWPELWAENTIRLDEWRKDFQKRFAPSLP